MPAPSEKAVRIGEELRRQLPGLASVGRPKGSLFGGEPPDPDLYPDATPTRGFYLPLPPPPGRKVRESSFVHLRGMGYGRPLRISVLVPDSVTALAPPTLTVETCTRLVRPDAPIASVLPWVVWAADPGPVKGVTLTNRGKLNLTGTIARWAIGRAGGFAGRPIPGVSLPPVRARVFTAAWRAEVGQLLVDPGFLTQAATWERRAGTGFANSGPTLPVFEAYYDRMKFATGLDPELPAAEHAATVREALDLLVQIERAATGMDPEITPIPTVTFQDPPDSFPDVRAAYPCPKCGRLEILRQVVTKDPTMGHQQTLNCGVDWFPPNSITLGQLRGAFDASEAAGPGPP